MKINQKLCVAYSADDNYAKYLGISMLSLFQSNKDFEAIQVFVLDCGIGGGNKEKLKSMAQDHKRDIQFLSMESLVSSLELSMGTRKISIASYARLFLSTIIPREYDRLLYLDCDTIILDCLSDLWTLDLGGYLLAGVRDTVDSFFLSKIGLKAKDDYINAGILLINLAEWRAIHIERQFMEMIRSFGGRVPHHDQGVINAVCREKKLIASPRYNVTSNIYSFSAKTIKRIYVMDSFYTQQELDEAKNNPAILHFTSGLVGRPWEENCSHPRREEYIKVANLSPWKKEPLLPDSRRLSVRAFAVFYKSVPHVLSETSYRFLSRLIHFRE